MTEWKALTSFKANKDIKPNQGSATRNNKNGGLSNVFELLLTNMQSLFRNEFIITRKVLSEQQNEILYKFLFDTYGNSDKVWQN